MLTWLVAQINKQCPKHPTAQTELSIFISDEVLIPHAQALFVVVFVEVLDALMNHLEETLEAVLSRGENLTLDNKVGN